MTRTEANLQRDIQGIMHRKTGSLQDRAAEAQKLAAQHGYDTEWTQRAKILSMLREGEAPETIKSLRIKAKLQKLADFAAISRARRKVLGMQSFMLEDHGTTNKKDEPAELEALKTQLKQFTESRPRARLPPISPWVKEGLLDLQGGLTDREATAPRAPRSSSA